MRGGWVRQQDIERIHRWSVWQCGYARHNGIRLVDLPQQLLHRQCLLREDSLERVVLRCRRHIIFGEWSAIYLSCVGVTRLDIRTPLDGEGGEVVLERVGEEAEEVVKEDQPKVEIL